MLTSWQALIHQRLRWDRTITIRLEGRKHVDMVYPWSSNFRWSDFIVITESWFFSLICAYGIIAWAGWLLVFVPRDWPFILLTLYFVYAFFELIQAAVAVAYSNNPGKSALIGAVFPIVLVYHTVLLVVRLVATTQEILVRRSYSEPFTPERVRLATWHW
jgi:hypothetical protein